MSPGEGFEYLGAEGLVLRSSALDMQRRKINKLNSPARDLMSIVRLVSEDLVYIPGLPLTIGSLDGLFALIGMAFELVVEIYVKNKC